MEERKFILDDRTVRVFPGPAGSPAVYLNSYMDNGGTIRRLTGQDVPEHSLIVISGLNWEDDMTPWYCPPLFRNDSACHGKADEYIIWMRDVLMTEAERFLDGVPVWRGIAGYSLGGLFAVYSLYRTGLFCRAASMSGSLWYPGLLPFTRSHAMKRRPECIYLSVGDRENRSRNRYLRTVLDNTQALAADFQNRGIETMFELNKGNHSRDSEERTAKGIRWILTHGVNAEES